MKTIGYWITTAILVFAILSGGVAELAHLRNNVEGIVHVLGYPLYFMTIPGFWKVLGAIALLAPRLPRLKEWRMPASSSIQRDGDNGLYAFPPRRQACEWHVSFLYGAAKAAP